MSILTKALDNIKFTIPIEVLNIAFRDTLQNWRQAPVSLDDLIMTKIIKPRVLVDTNLVGGVTVLVSLEGVQPRFVDNYAVLYEVPAEKIMYREIISVLSVSYLPVSGTYGTLGNSIGNVLTTNDVSSAAQRVSNSFANIPVTSTATVDLVGYNTILIRDQQRVTSNYQLRCVLANEENLNNINPRSYLAFAKLCELAVKAYIYNTLIISIDKAYLVGGQELGAIKNYVDNLSDSNEMYNTYLREVWQATAFMNQTQAYSRFIKVQISPGI